MDVLLSFAAALISLRLAGRLLRAGRIAWAGGLLSFAAAAGAMAWGAAHGWDEASFRVYYLAGALLSAPLLGIGSLQLWRRPWAAPLGLLYTGLAVGVAVTMDVHGTFDGTTVPRAQDHVDVLPRVVAIAGSSLGALAVVVVAAATLRRRPRANALDRRSRRGGRSRLGADPDRGLRRVGVLRARGRAARRRRPGRQPPRTATRASTRRRRGRRTARRPSRSRRA